MLGDLKFLIMEAITNACAGEAGYAEVG